MQTFLLSLLLATLSLLAGYLFFLRQQKQFTGNLGTRETSPQKGTPGDKIVVTGFFTPVGNLTGSVSPFTSKIETYLRFAGLPFKTQDGGFAGSPKGRVSDLGSFDAHTQLCPGTGTTPATQVFCAASMDAAWQGCSCRLAFHHQVSAEHLQLTAQNPGTTGSSKSSYLHTGAAHV